MSEDIPVELKYTQSHEWVLLEDDGTIRVGITHHAQEVMGDMVFIETPEIDMEYSAADACGVIESVKAAADIYSPISGKIIDANNALVDEPELVNSDPYGEGWIFKMLPDDEDDVEELIGAEGYAAFLEDDDDDGDIEDDET